MYMYFSFVLIVDVASYVSNRIPIPSLSVSFQNGLPNQLVNNQFLSLQRSNAGNTGHITLNTTCYDGTGAYVLSSTYYLSFPTINPPCISELSCNINNPFSSSMAIRFVVQLPSSTSVPRTLFDIFPSVILSF